MAIEECHSLRVFFFLFIFTLLLLGIHGGFDIPNVSHFTQEFLQSDRLKRNTQYNVNLYSSSPLNFYTIKQYHDFEIWRKFWVDLSKSENSVPLKSIHNGVKISLLFGFPFNNHIVEKFVISQTGCLNFEDQDDGIAQNICIAPFMADYDSSRSESRILYSSEKNHFTVQWQKLQLINTSEKDIEKSITFQLSLFANGTLVFAYKKVPFNLSAKDDETFRVGIFAVPLQKKSSAESSHHLLQINLRYITAHTVITLSPKKDFLQYEIDGEGIDVSRIHSLPKHRVHKRAAELTFSTVTTDSPKNPREYDDPFDDYDDDDESNEDSKAHHTHHNYYNSSIYTEPSKWQTYWVNLDDLKDKNIHVMLSNSYRKGVTVTLSFDFPFYGHKIRNITVTTGGFLFTGAHVHSWLAATQYIAPLMANFDPSLQNSSVIKYADNGTAFTVEWENVRLRDKTSAGNFTFQVTLFNSGDILFVYKQVPLSVTEISDEDHPVKIGLSDAYIIDRTIFYLRRKTIYEYHRVDLKKPTIKNSTSIYFTALPTCKSMTDCQSCISLTPFECSWCSDRCSDGIDRFRQEWILQGCSQQLENQVCPEITSPELNEETEKQPSTMIIPAQMTISTQNDFLNSTLSPNTSMTLSVTKSLINVLHPEKSNLQGNSDHVSLGTAGIVGVLFVVTMIVAFSIWIFYAYRYPHTTSGQLLIKYRPTQWHWPRSETRYTAASVHM